MALPSSGAISLSQVNTELGLSATALISMNDSGLRSLFGIASGAISMSNGYGKANGIPMAVGGPVSPYIAAYNTTDAGWGTKAANPGTLPPAYPTQGKWAGSSIIASVNYASPATTNIYPWSGGFGTKYAEPATAPAVGTGNAIAISQGTVNAVVIGGNTAPNYAGYAFTQAGGFGTKFAAPAVSASTTTEMRFSRTGNTLFIGRYTTPWLVAFDMTSSAFGTQRSSSSLTQAPQSVSIPSSTGNFVMTVGLNTTTPLNLFPYTEGVGFGTAIVGPTQVGYNVNGGAMSPDINTNGAMIWHNEQAPTRRAYRITSTAWGTAYTGIVGAGSGNPDAGAWRKTGDQVAFSGSLNANVNITPWTYASGYGTKFTPPTTSAPDVGAPRWIEYAT